MSLLSQADPTIRARVQMINTSRVRAALYGQAVGDALGIPAEYKSAQWIADKYGNTGPSTYEDVQRKNGDSWKAGEWSDDTEMAVCILDAYLRSINDDCDPQAMLDVNIVADEFLKWKSRNPMGMGGYTKSILSNALYAEDPISVALAAWEDSGRKAASNGAVMRTSVVGLLRPWDSRWTVNNAAEIARTTHYDPRCVASAVALSAAIAMLVQGRLVTEATEFASHCASLFALDASEWILPGKNLEDLKLDEGIHNPKPPIGYTYKCLGAAFWALRTLHAEHMLDHYGLQSVKPISTYLEVLQTVIRAGGDTDTNAAVAGALMGAMVGVDGIPQHLIDGLLNRSALDERINRLLLTYPE